ncbi:hypothetical protein TA3x_003284 [Tundrisphaera sp. TA3]|uniref:hypothetical protein n=1 Tax=Tundrisphaera sp. TA3 TaxID=3435775 RepID=UPI003EBC743D
MGDLGDLTDWPPIADKSARDRLDRDRMRSLSLDWVFIYLLNLPVCLILGGFTTMTGGWPGMLTGILLLFALGFYSCRMSYPLGLAFIKGGFLLGLAQILPMAQLLAGSMGLGLAGEFEAMSGSPLRHEYELRSFASGLIATLGTGGLLMMLALVFGLIHRLMVPDWRDNFPRDLIEPMKPARDVLHDFR